MNEIGLYEIVKARYVFFLRKKEIIAKAKKKTASESKRLSELSKEKQEIIMKIVEGKASKNDYTRLKKINDELLKLRTQINNKTKTERKIAMSLSSKVKQFDNVITSLLITDYKKEVEEPVQAALDGRPELAEVVVIHRGQNAPGGVPPQGGDGG